MFMSNGKAAVLFSLALAAAALGAGEAVRVRAERPGEAVVAENAPKEPKPTQAASVRQLRERLARPIEEPLEIAAGTPLKDALAFISDRYKVPVLTDREIFKLMDPNDPDVEKRPVELAKTKGIGLNRALRLVLSQAGATYRIQPGHVEVTHPGRLRPDQWDPRAFSDDNQPIYDVVVLGQLPPSVEVDFDKVPLKEALAELADLSGVNVVLDVRVAEKGQALVTARLNHVPVNNAVKVLADMCGLTYVVEGQVLYVTTKDNAKELQQEKARMGLPLPFGALPPM